MAYSDHSRGWMSAIFPWVASALLGFTVIGSQSAQAQTFTTLYSFPGRAHGAYPYAGLIRNSNGTLYGTTNGGGSSSHGTVFSITKAGKERVLHSFAKPRDGEYPYGPLYEGASGSLYGTTPYGGSSGKGTVFRVDGDGREVVLHRFRGRTDGFNPFGWLVQDAEGTLYGTTLDGGATGHGTVFKVDRKGKETVLHSFISFVKGDGAYPYAGLTADRNGNLYGTTIYGGIAGCFIGCGAVFKVDTTGVLTTVYGFLGGEDGMFPYAGLALDSKGALYGTTSQGGTFGYGTVFKVDAQGNESVLYTFAGGADGAYPYAGVVLDAGGNVYGTTVYGGVSGYGILFEVDATGVETVQHSFSYSDGAYPYAGMVPDGKGNFYGTTQRGGSDGYGTVFKLTP